MLEYTLIRDGKEVHNGTIGNQFKFFELTDALRNIHKRLPNQFPIVYKFFPMSNDGEIPFDELKGFLKEFKAIGKEKVQGNELTFEKRSDKKFLLSKGFEFTQIRKDLYEVVNEDGFNLVMEKSSFVKESNSQNRIALSIPYEQKGTNWNVFSKIELQNPIIVFQSKSFTIRSLESLHLYIGMEDNKKRFLYYSPYENFGIIERGKFGQGEISFEHFNYIYIKILDAITQAFSEGCTIKWG